MRKTTATVLLASLMAAAAVNCEAGEARLMRFPATNGSEVTFSYAGDR